MVAGVISLNAAMQSAMDAIQNAKGSPPPEPDYWDAFWTLIWRREQKKDARVAWAKIDARLYPQIVIAVAAWRPIYLGRGDTRFIPLPATWLNGERWDDDIPPEYLAQNVARPMTVLPEMPRKSGEIPANVLAQIAKLKGR